MPNLLAPVDDSNLEAAEDCAFFTMKDVKEAALSLKK